MARKQNLDLEKLFLTDKLESKRKVIYNAAFLRKPYQYTPAEVADKSYDEVRKKRGDVY